MLDLKYLERISEVTKIDYSGDDIEKLELPEVIVNLIDDLLNEAEVLQEELQETINDRDEYYKPINQEYGE